LPGCAPGAFPVTCNPGIPGGTNGTPISDIIAEPNFATRYSSFSNGDFHFWNWAFSTFFQDDVKVTQRLTLNVGVRWEYFGYPSERDGKGTNINTQLAALAPVPQTAAPCPQSPLNPAPPTPCPGSSLIGFTVPSNYNTAVLGAIPVDVFRRHHTSMGEETAPFDNFVPRLGFAWQPLSTNKFVVRGGVGFFYDYIGGELYVHGVLQSVPYAETLGGAGPAISFASLQQPYATTAANWTPRFVTASGASSNIFQPLLPVSLPVPLTYLWNLNTQYEVLPSLVVELGYVGSHGIHQNNNVNNVFPANPALLQNAAITGAAPVVGNAALRTPLLGFSPQIQAYANDTNSKYNAMQLSARKNFSHGLSFQAVYTWSRALVGTWQGNSAIRGATANPTWSLNPVIEHYGLNNVYHPQRFTFNYVYDLPFGQHEGVLGWLAKGWRVSGATTIQDGAPISVLDNNLGSIFGFSGGTPLASAAQYRVGQSNATAATHGSIDSRVINGWINAAAFCPSTAAGDPCQSAYAISDGFGFGNAGQGNLLGPPQHNWDISLSKITRVGGIRESATLEFRTEFFNAFNHPQFNNPNNTQPGSVNPDVSTPSTLAITGLSVNPRLIQFALKYAF